MLSITSFTTWIGSKTTGSRNRRIFLGMVSIGTLTLVVKVVALLRELIVASRFGTGADLDAYLIAMLVPTITVQVLAGSIGNIFIPAFVTARQDGGIETAKRLTESTLFFVISELMVASILVLAALPWILPLLASGFEPGTLALTSRLLHFLLPIMFLFGCTSLLTALMNANELFIAAAIVPAITPAITILSLVLLSPLGIYSMVAGVLAGGCLEIAVLSIVLKRKGLLCVPRWNGLNETLKELGKQYPPILAAALLMSGAGLVDQTMAAMLSPGSVASLSYGTRIVSVIVSVIALGTGTAVFPHFSLLVAQKDWVSVVRTFRYWRNRLIWILIPITAVFVLGSPLIVRLLYERGSFSESDTALVSTIQAYSALQIPFFVLGILGVRLLSAARKNYLIFTISVCNLCINIAANYLFMQFLGVAGIALSTSLVYALSCVVISISVSRLTRDVTPLSGRV